MDKTFANTLQNAQSILVHLPTKPYFDQVAAGLSLFLSLQGKDVSVYSPSPMTVEFNRLVGVNKVKNELGNKNLVIKFSDYEGKNIERVSADIEDGLFKLTVIPKPNTKAPEQSQIETSYSGLSSDTVILIGGANESHFPSLSSNDISASLIHIGTRPLSTSRQVQSFVNDASSLSEVVASLIVDSSMQSSDTVQGLFTIDSDIATNLMMGIEEATNNLSSETATADTFFYISELMRVGGRRHTNTVKESTYPPGAIPQVGTTQKQSPSDDPAPQNWLEKPRIYKGTTS